jgi:hypothetical protein
MVDGFAGGGADAPGKSGSPFAPLEAVETAAARINLNRQKKLRSEFRIPKKRVGAF